MIALSKVVLYENQRQKIMKAFEIRTNTMKNFVMRIDTMTCGLISFHGVV